MKKQTIAVLGPGSWGTALSQVLNDNGHEVRIWGNISDQIDEINNQHTNKRYFKDILLDEKIKAYHDLEETLKDVDAVLFVVPTKVTRLVAQQVAKVLDHKVVIMHASKGLEPDSHKRLSTILEGSLQSSVHLQSWKTNLSPLLLNFIRCWYFIFYYSTRKVSLCQYIL